MNLMPVIVMMGALVAQSGAAPGVHVWKATEIHERGEALVPKLDANKVATDNIAKVDNLSFMVAHREGPGQSEVHDNEIDIMFISEGKVTMVYGGTVVGGKQTAPGQIRGSGITGGVEVTLGPGDVLHIPAKVPHQMKLAPGAKVTYFVAKVIQ